MENKEYINQKTYGNVTVVENSKHQWAVIDNEGNFIVPFGKYGWIDGFDSGLARVKINGGVSFIGPLISKKDRWGIINEMGEEVLPVNYDQVWNFLGKNRYSTRVVIDGRSSEVFFHTLNPSLPKRGIMQSCDDYDDYGTHFGEFAGSYAQEVMGYSDDVINDAFDGDPDAYWNID